MKRSRHCGGRAAPVEDVGCGGAPPRGGVRLGPPGLYVRRSTTVTWLREQGLRFTEDEMCRAYDKVIPPQFRQTAEMERREWSDQTLAYRYMKWLSNYKARAHERTGDLKDLTEWIPYRTAVADLSWDVDGGRKLQEAYITGGRRELMDAVYDEWLCPPQNPRFRLRPANGKEAVGRPMAQALNHGQKDMLACSSKEAMKKSTLCGTDDGAFSRLRELWTHFDYRYHITEVWREVIDRQGHAPTRAAVGRIGGQRGGAKGDGAAGGAAGDSAAGGAAGDS
eukprot:gene2991-13171_t